MYVESGGNGIIGCVLLVVYGEWEEVKVFLVLLDFLFCFCWDLGCIEFIEIVVFFEFDKNISLMFVWE